MKSSFEKDDGCKANAKAKAKAKVWRYYLSIQFVYKILHIEWKEQRMDAIEQFRRWIWWQRFTNRRFSCRCWCATNTSTNLSSDHHYRSILLWNFAYEWKKNYETLTKRNQLRMTDLVKRKKETNGSNEGLILVALIPY